jgi:putative oxidoreductase
VEGHGGQELKAQRNAGQAILEETCKQTEFVVAFVTPIPSQNLAGEHVMARVQTEPKLLFPSLRPFYDTVAPLSWLIIRVAVGWNLLVHGYNKIMVGPTDAFLKAYTDLGFTPPAFWFWTSTTLETLAGISLILGLFTRFFAAAIAIEMLIITITEWANGFGWLHRGYEYTLLWGLVSFAIALRGGGPYSLDRKLGREL